MSVPIPNTIKDFGQDLSYEIVKIADDGWCLYRAYLTGLLGADPDQQEIEDIAKAFANKLKTHLENLSFNNANTPFTTPIHHTDSIINALVPIAQDISGLPGQKGWYTQIPAKEDAATYITVESIDPSGNIETNNMEYVTDVSEYVHALYTSRDDDFAKGPLIWPDISILKHVIEQPSIIIYSDDKFRSGGVDNNTHILLLHTGGNHFDLIKLKGPHFPNWYWQAGGAAGGAAAGASVISQSSSPAGSPTLSAGVQSGRVSPLNLGTSASASTPQPLQQSPQLPAISDAEIKPLLEEIAALPDSEEKKKLMVIIGAISLIRAMRRRKARQAGIAVPKPTVAVKKPTGVAVGDISGRLVAPKPTGSVLQDLFVRAGKGASSLGSLIAGAVRGLGPGLRPTPPATRIPIPIRSDKRDFSTAPLAVQRIAKEPAGPYVQVSGTPIEIKAPVAPPVPTLPAEVKPMSVVTTYVKVGDRLLIHRRAKGSSEELTLSTPSGSVDVSDGSYPAAAVRELKEEAQLVIPAESLMPLRVTQFNDKYMVAFYVDMAAAAGKPAIPGPQEKYKTELDMTYDFAGISGETAGGGHFWASIQDLPAWLMINKEFKNPMFYENLVALMLQFPNEFTIPQDAPDDVVYSIDSLDQRLSWVPKRIFSSQDLKATWLCQFEQTRVSPCEPWELRDALIAADKFKEHDRLGAHLATNPDIVEYRKMTNRIKELKDTSKPHDKDAAKELQTLEKEFSDKYLQMRKVHVMRSLKPDGDYSEKTFSIPNPVHAVSYREDEVTDFANPRGISKYDPSGAMLQMNRNVLQAIAYPEIIADKHMAISILESLWYCNGDVSMSKEPRCYPARVLGQLREYEAAKIQESQKQKAEEYLRSRSAWPEIKRIIRAMKNALIGSQIVAFNDALAPPLDPSANIVTPPVTIGSTTAVGAGNQVVTASATASASGTGTSALRNQPQDPQQVAAGAGSPASGVPETPSSAAAAAPESVVSRKHSAGRPGTMGPMARGVAVIVPRGIGALGFQGLLPQPLGAPPIGAR